jgi:hypothetical protein
MVFDGGAAMVEATGWDDVRRKRNEMNGRVK